MISEQRSGKRRRKSTTHMHTSTQTQTYLEFHLRFSKIEDNDVSFSSSHHTQRWLAVSTIHSLTFKKTQKITSDNAKKVRHINCHTHTTQHNTNKVLTSGKLSEKAGLLCRPSQYFIVLSQEPVCKQLRSST